MSDLNDKELDFDFEDDDFDLLDEHADTPMDEVSVGVQDELNDTMQNVDDKIQQNALDTNEENNNEQDIDNRQLILYILTDRVTSNLIDYFRNAGLPVSAIFNSVKEARDEMIYQIEPARLVIIESGLGKFTSVSARGELLDLIGIADEDNKISVFYTDSAIKADAKDSLDMDWKKIDWNKYVSTPDTVAQLLLKKEAYILDDSMVFNDKEKDENVWDRTGIEFTGKTSEATIGIPAFTLEQLMKNMESADFDEIPRYDIRY